MKLLRSLKLKDLGNYEIQRSEMNNLKGGYNCGCGCKYANSSGSAEDVNMVYNAASSSSSSSYHAWISSDVTYYTSGGNFYYKASEMGRI